MRVLLLSISVMLISGCFSAKVFKQSHNPPNQTQPAPNIKGSIPKFDTLDTNKDGVITKDEHDTASKHSAVLTPYLVFGGILTAIVVICFLSGFRYAPFWEGCKRCLDKGRRGFMDLLKKYNNKRND
tara:strand:+ start:6950 stop:7330 length:381 start_codon:yes stop_codon:yes gene_type:complete